MCQAHTGCVHDMRLIYCSEIRFIILYKEIVTININKWYGHILTAKVTKTQDKKYLVLLQLGLFYIYFNPLTPNDNYRGRTAPLTSKVAFYIFIQQI